MTARRMRNYIPITALILVSVILFFNALSTGFMWDDKELIVKHRYIKSLRYSGFLFTPQYWNRFSASDRGHYKPIRALTFSFDFLIWKLNPFGYHLTNLLLHIFNVVLIYFFINALIASSRDRPPRQKDSIASSFLSVGFLGALFFAAHPIHTESVTWIKNRSDLLALVFFLLALLSFIRYSASDASKKGRLFLGLALILMALSLFSKEAALSLPLIVILYILCFTKIGLKKALLSSLPFFGVALAYLSFKALFLRVPSPSETGIALPFYNHGLAVLKTAGYYLMLLAAPFKLNADRSLDIPRSFWEPGVLLSAASLVIIGAAIVISFRRSKILAFSLSWILATLAPASNIIFLSSRPIAEQRLYIPSLGFSLLLGLGLEKACMSNARIFRTRLTVRLLAIIAAIALFFSYAFTIVARNRDWVDSVRFWKKTAESSPESGRADYNLGVAYSRAGDHEKAIEVYRQIIKKTEQYAEPYNSLGNEYRELGMIKEAKASFEKALAIDPDFAEAHNNLGVINNDMGKVKLAISSYEKAIELDPDYTEAYCNLGKVYMDTGDNGRAVVLFKKCIEIDPLYAEAYNNLGSAYAAQKNYQDALAAYMDAIEKNPRYAEAYNNFGVILLKANEMERALLFFKKSFEIDPKNKEACNNMAVAYYALKKYDLAVEYCDRTLGLGAQVNPEFLKLLAPFRAKKAQ